MRLRNRKQPKRVPAPAITNALAGNAIEFGFEWEVDEVVEEGAIAGFVGKHLRKEFFGEWFYGVVSGVVDGMEGEGGVLYKVKYEDGDEEEMTAEEIRAVGG